MRAHLSLLVFFSLGVAACAGDVVDDGPSSGTITLAAADFRLEPGEEAYVCVRTTVPEGLWIGGFAALAPPGTHHATVSLVDDGEPDGAVPCQPQETGDALIYGSGVGTEPLSLPEGVAIHLPAGQQLLMNLHLLNVSGEPIRGRAGVTADLVPRHLVRHEAEVVLAGKDVGLFVPPRAVTTEVGTCTMSEDVTLAAFMPHMHQLGVAMKLELARAEGSSVVYDELYSFDDQRFHMLGEVPMAAGDALRVHCTYDNPTDRVVGFGGSTYDEMCYAVLFRYPAIGEGAFCTR